MICTQGRRSVVKVGGGGKLLISTLLFSQITLFPIPPLPLEVEPLKSSQGLGERYKLHQRRSAVIAPHVRSEAEPQPKSNFVHFYPKKS